MAASSPVASLPEGAVMLVFNLPEFIGWSIAAFLVGFLARKTLRKFSYLAGGSYYDG